MLCEVILIPCSVRFHGITDLANNSDRRENKKNSVFGSMIREDEKKGKPWCLLLLFSHFYGDTNIGP